MMMRPVSPWQAVLLTGVLALSGHCGSAQGQGATPATATKSTSAAQPTAVASSPLEITPSVHAGQCVYQSWPLLLEASLWRDVPPKRPKAATPALGIETKQGAWREALVVTVRGASGAAAKWPLHLVANPASKLRLSPGGELSASWWMSAEETKTLPTGDYVISVAFDAQKVAGLPSDPAATQIDTCQVTVAKEPSPLTPALQQTKLYEGGCVSFARGDMAGAADAATKLLALDPNSIAARRVQAKVLLSQKKLQEALATENEALGIFVEEHPKSGPPIGLLAERDEIISALHPSKPKPKPEPSATHQ